MNLIESFLNHYQIYCDLDGVLTNFEKAVDKLGHGSYEDVMHKYSAEYFWAIVARKKAAFWADMEWMPDGKELWNYIKKYNPTILSAPTKNPTSSEGKKIWMKRELPGVPLLLEMPEDKSKHANNHSILIDDRAQNIRMWREKNGIGILHLNAKDTIQKLKKYVKD